MDVGEAHLGRKPSVTMLTPQSALDGGCGPQEKLREFKARLGEAVERYERAHLTAVPKVLSYPIHAPPPREAVLDVLATVEWIS